VRPGYVAAPFGYVEAHGGDLEEVRAWVETHDGRAVDNPSTQARTGLHRGIAFASATPPRDRRRFILPASALGLKAM
jgi:hypothetical protein